jgi:PmbA protein
VVSNGKEMSNDFQIKLGKLDEIDTDTLTKKAADEAVLKMGGDVAPTGNYPVVFSPGAMASLLGVYSSIFSSEAAQKGLSKLSGREGEQVAAACVTIVDDPFHKDNPMPMNFDAEGSPTHCKNVVENGVLKTLLYNRMYAKLMGRETTGNANDAKTIGPNGLYLAAGALSEEALLERLGNGLYVTSFQGLHAGANTGSGDFSLQAKGFLVENGKKTRAVKNFTVADNFFSLIKKVDELSDKVKFSATSSIGAPDVLFTDVSISGK